MTELPFTWLRKICTSPEVSEVNNCQRRKGSFTGRRGRLGVSLCLYIRCMSDHQPHDCVLYTQSTQIFKADPVYFRILGKDEEFPYQMCQCFVQHWEEIMQRSYHSVKPVYTEFVIVSPRNCYTDFAYVTSREILS